MSAPGFNFTSLGLYIIVVFNLIEHEHEHDSEYTDDPP